MSVIHLNLRPINQKQFVLSYFMNVNRAAEIWRSEPKTPLEIASHWVDRLLKFGHLDHLKTQDSHLNFLQYWCLDILAFMTLPFIIFKVICAAVNKMKR